MSKVFQNQTNRGEIYRSIFRHRYMHWSKECGYLWSKWAVKSCDFYNWNWFYTNFGWSWWWTNPIGTSNFLFQLVILPGVSSALDAIGCSICNENDGILTPAPYYLAIYNDFKERSGAEVIPVPISDRSARNDGKNLVKAFESCYYDAQKKVQSSPAIAAHFQSDFDDSYSRYNFVRQ